MAVNVSQRARNRRRAKAPFAASASRAAAVLAVACAAALSACGIDTISYLSVDPESVGDLIFEGPNTSSELYLGVELYYRIYELESDAASDRAALQSKQNATDSVPGSWIESYLLSSSGLKYQRPILINRADGSNVGIPAIRKSLISADGSIVSIYRPSAGNEAAMVISDGDSEIAAYSLLRNEKDDLDKYLSFLDKPVSGDADLRTNTADEEEETYFIQFFAVSYGFDISSSSGDLYGDAVYVGGMTLSY